MIEDRPLTTSDGQELGAWLVRGDPNRPCVLVLHGNGSSRSGMLGVIQILAKPRCTVLAVTLRAHGDSTGEVNDLGWSARHDVVAGVALLKKEFPGRPVYVLGRSLGAAAAIFAAEELGESVAGYVLEQPYTDIKSATWNRLQKYLPPGLDAVAYLGLRLWGPVFLPVDANKISPYERIVDIPECVRVVVMTGSADRQPSPDEVSDLAARIASHSRLIMFAGADHVGLEGYDPVLYRDMVLYFLSHGPSSSGGP
jgi:uncharacterized protein